MNGIIVKLENVNGKQVPAVTSQQLAEVFGKEHYNVLRDIRETVAKCSKSFCALNFEGAEYLDEQGKSRPMYLMTKDGFTMVAMAYTTPEAMRFKEAYIAEFNRMEPIGMGTAYAVMLDTGKLHSDGTPIRQLKWDTGVIPVIQNFLDAEIED